MPPRGMSEVEHSLPPDRRSLERTAGARCPLFLGAQVAGIGARHRPDSERSCELALCAVAATGGRPGEGARCAYVRDVQGGALFLARPPVLGACNLGPLPTGCGCGVRVWGPASPTVRAALQALRSLEGSVFLGIFSCVVVRCVLCALPRIAGPGGCCCLAPARLPWLRLAACLSCVPNYPALVRRASSDPVALRALVGFPIALLCSPPRGCCPQIYWAAALGT